MKTKLRSLLALLALTLAAPLALNSQPSTLNSSALAAEKSADAKSKNCGCACCQGKEICCCHAAKADAEPTSPADSAKRYPLRGVIVAIDLDQSSLLVKHEAIPNFMPAMTMLFKVDAATLRAAQKGQLIAATLVERDGDFALENVEPAGPK